MLVGISLDKVAFLRFNVLLAEEVFSSETFLKGKTLFFICHVLFHSSYAWVIIVIRNITLTRLIVESNYTKIGNSIKEIVIESLS